MLAWLTALTFSLMKDARAADPNVTFLDDGNITYKDLEHGAFELVTKEAVPRHIIVEDPGQTIVLRPQGSSVSVNQVTNSPTRMAELQEAQQEVLATATKGVGSTGSSTPPFDDALSVQPINFIQNDSTPAGAEHARASTGELRLGPRDHHRASAAARTNAADVQCFDRAGRNRHRRRSTRFTATTGNFVASALQRRRTNLRHQRGNRRQHGGERGDI